MRRFLSTLAFALTVLASACARSDADWKYSVPEVVDEASLLARLTPTEDGELVLANFWASW